MTRNILITGAAGTGTTTLARALAHELRATHLEADVFLWLPSYPPYQHQVEKAQRCERLLHEMRRASRAVVAGSIRGWGCALEDAFDLMVFLYLPVDLRLERLTLREVTRFGHVKPEFLAWAAQYDNGAAPGRSLARHQDWLSKRTCPVIRLVGDMSVTDRLHPTNDAIDIASRKPPII